MVRFKNRYLVVEIAHNDGRAMEERGKERAVLDTLRESLRDNFGDVGLGRALGALSVRYVDAVTGVCVVRCGREVAREVRGAIATVEEVRGRRAAAAVTHCGGTVRRTREACARRLETRALELVARGRLKAEQAEALVETQRQVIQSAVYN